MSDLPSLLPTFDTSPFKHLLYSLEKNDITLSDLIAFDAIEIAKRCPLPLRDLKALIEGVVEAVQAGVLLEVQGGEDRGNGLLECESQVVSTLDVKLDACLGGGFYTRHVTEIVGESAVGKTQFASSLLLSCQLPAPHGLGRSAIYVSTEAPLNTARLMQMISSHPHYQSLSEEDRPSLDRIHAIATNNLETQEHIVRHQLPIAIQRLDVGLVVMDSVAANFRAEHGTQTAKDLADRANELMKLGRLLRDLATEHNIAVVVMNQVSDRFDDAGVTQDRFRSSPMPVSSPTGTQTMAPPTSSNIARDENVSLDHQQRFFTGWGDTPARPFEQLKTPALGLAWANQISARIALKMSEHSTRRTVTDSNGNIWSDRKKRRFMSVVFAPWIGQTIKPVEYEIQSQGPASVPERTRRQPREDSHTDLLDPSLWSDGAGDDEDEFP